jgi:hypothetical protein
MRKETLFETKFFTENTDPSVIGFIRSKGWKITSEYNDQPEYSDPYIVYTPSMDHFWTSDYPKTEIVDCLGIADELTITEFKQRIGFVPKKEVSVRNKLDELIKTDGKAVIDYLKELLVREDNILKELRFAEAKKERLEKHIEVLKSKLQ